MTETSSAMAILSADLERLVVTMAPSVVAVHSRRSRSSGFVWRPGLIVTADEALAEEGEISIVYSGGQTAPATLAGRDPTTDMALLRVDADLTPVSLASNKVTSGSLGLVVGSREGEPVVSLGWSASADQAAGHSVAARSTRESSSTCRSLAKLRAAW